MNPCRHALLPLLVALAGCGGAEESAEGERKTAAGEVLGGSISDDMLPLDTVTSESPRMREAPEGEAGSSAPVDGAQLPPRDSDEGPGEPPRDPAPQPAAEAAGEPATEG